MLTPIDQINLRLKKHTKLERVDPSRVVYYKGVIAKLFTQALTGEVSPA